LPGFSTEGSRTCSCPNEWPIERDGQRTDPKDRAALSEFLEAISVPGLQSAKREEWADFLAGNPQEIAPDEFVSALQRWAEPLDKDWYGYKMAHPPALEVAARGLTAGLGIDFRADSPM
jgi:hypothetical protein